LEYILLVTWMLGTQTSLYSGERTAQCQHLR